MVSIRHRSASGTLDNMWEYDPERRVLIVVVRNRATTIPVASEKNPRRFAYAISRKSETTWQVAPAMYFRKQNDWYAIAIGFDEGLCDFLFLTHAPADVNQELEALS